MPTVDELRNEIRVAVGRFERETTASFTKEDLRDIAAAVGHEVDTSGRLPPKPSMRAGILDRVDGVEADGQGDAERPLRKGELEAIHAAVTGR